MAQESFNITGAGNKIAQDRLNVCFKNIQTLIDQYEPLVTRQDFDILSFSGTFKAGEKFYSDYPPSEEVNVYGLYGTTYVKLGVLSVAGELTITRDGTFLVYQPYRINRNDERAKIVKNREIL